MDPDLDGTWRYDWPAGRRLLAELSTLAPLAGRRVADLGCGRGRLGLAALDLGATSVVFADASPAALAALAADLAGHPRAACARLCEHRWGAPLPGGPCDLILGGDILYLPQEFPALLDTVAVSLADGGQALLADPRSTLEAELPRLAQARGLTWTQTRRPGGYTLAVAGWSGR